MFGLDLIQTILGGIGIAAIAVIAAWFKGRRTGRTDAIAKSNQEDQEHAESIRRRVSVDHDQRVRDYDDAGFRD